MRMLEGRWKLVILFHLFGGQVQRFSDLEKRVTGISQKMLTATLRDLEKDGFVTRKVTPTIPPRVDYELTEMGRELRHPLNTISEWARANRVRVEAARTAFAAQQAELRAQAW